jgi:hypothetical protein
MVPPCQETDKEKGAYTYASEVNSRTTVAGSPATIVEGGTSLDPTLPAPTTPTTRI